MLTAKEQGLLDALEPTAREKGVDIVTVECVHTKRKDVVRVYLETEGLDTFEVLTSSQEWINPIIDKIDPFPGAYMLEVSSPGIDRPLRTREHFERFAGEKVQVKADKPVDFSNYKYQYFWLSGNQWVSWSGRFTLHFAIDELCFGLGYSMSNYDIWSTRRNGIIEGTSFSEFYPEQRPLYHYFFVYTAWKF